MTDDERREYNLASGYKVGPPKTTKDSDDALFDTLIELSWQGAITGYELVAFADSMQYPLLV